MAELHVHPSNESGVFLVGKTRKAANHGGKLDTFVVYPEKKGKDLEATREACKKFQDTPTSVINFVEGTRFSEEKRVARNSPYERLLPPRAGGVAVAISSMGELFDAIVDVTLVYPDGVVVAMAMALDLAASHLERYIAQRMHAPERQADMICGQQVTVTVDVKTRAIDPELLAGDYQNDREYRRVMHGWLAAIWEDKDARIAEIKDRVA